MTARRRAATLPLHHLDVPDPAVLPFAAGSFDEIGPMSRAGFAHRHRFHEIVYVTGGSGNHMIDFVRYPLRPPHLCVIVPGQVHSWADASGLSGQVILFTDEFLRDQPADRAALRELGRRPWRAPRGVHADRLASAVAELNHEYALRAADHPSALRALLHVLIVRASRLPGAAPVGPADRPSQVAREFVALLGGPDPVFDSVAGYAARLGVSVSLLASAVRQETGGPPGARIRQAQVLEARRLLAGTELTVARVAERVGFTDPAYFCRFFRRETGQTPGSYRRQARNTP